MGNGNKKQLSQIKGYSRREKIDKMRYLGGGDIYQ